ncbi:MAG: MotA/TolQ/ExbB proton channel family protein [Pseudomonadales bacterium]|nr:MotA/TolQ/ExbB proton channel family protein [Pseudomonadales bacterium]
MLEQISQFMNAGGEVLYLIAALTFLMWTLIFERIYYFLTELKSDINNAIERWEARDERQSWHAKKVRAKLISEVRLSINQNMPMIRTMVALCPLFGLLGTVWGMIEVFNIMAVTGGGEAKAMAGGVSKATIPTMAGMVAALSGVFANMFLTRVVERESLLLEDHMTLDH